MSTQNTSNAPMPAAAPAAPAETFDSTVSPPQGNVSAIGLPGPDNREAPMHSGMVNGIDPFFFKQYVALEQFTWTTSQDPATLLFSRPVHPRRSHQWMTHLSQMYNTFAGGFDFAFKIAGTGFHAGAIYIVRLPPNIPPESLKTNADITAFEYFVIDPKTLEVEVKSVMDQRNVMFHWMDEFDVSKPQTFGGFIAAYVLMPLNTSSTGATSIQVQVWTKPSQNFMFSQIKPLASGPKPYNPTKELIEAALNFTSVGNAPLYLRGSAPLFEMQPNFIKCYDIMDVAQADGKLYWDTKMGIWNQGKFLKISEFNSTNIKKSVGADGWFGLNVSQSSYIDVIFQNSDNVNLPIHFGSTVWLTIVMRGAPETVAQFYATASISPNAKYARFTFNNIANRDYYKLSKKQIPGWDDGTEWMDKFDQWFDEVYISPTDNSCYIDHDSTAFVPSGTNEVICRSSRPFVGPQFATIQNLFFSGILKDELKQGEAVFLELYDADADLPVGKFKLYFEGFITGAAPTKIIDYNFSGKKYKFNFLRIGPANTPLYANVAEMQKYHKNRALAQLFSPEFRNTGV